MGRNKKMGLDYFPFDIDFFQDLKIRKLIKYQGGKAVTVYALLLCNIYRQGYYMRWDEELPFAISEQTGFEEVYIREVIKCCMVVGLFSKKLFESEKILTSFGIQDRYKNICFLCRRKADIFEFNLISSEEKAISSEEMPITSEESTQRKGKKRKENNSPIIPPYDLDPVVSLSDLRPLIFNNEQIWYEKIGMTLHLNQEEIIKWLNNFFDELECTGEVLKSISDFKSHFFRWLKIQLKDKKEVKNEKDTGNTVYKIRH